MKQLLTFILFLSVNAYGQTDLTAVKKQVESDSTELIKTQFRIRELKRELDSIKSESEKYQILIDQLKQENILLEQHMRKYLDQMDRKTKNPSRN